MRWDQRGGSDRIGTRMSATSLYYIKPPFPSGGGFAAASAGG